MTAAKAAGASESAWLNYADQAVQTAERTFKEAMRTHAVPAAWLGSNPKPAYETRGGALGDIPQTAVEYLNGLSLAAARDKVTRVAIGLDTTDPLLFEEDEDDSDEEDDPPQSERPAVTPGVTTGKQIAAKPKSV
jgi:hypothetical protein